MRTPYQALRQSAAAGFTLLALCCVPALTAQDQPATDSPTTSHSADNTVKNKHHNKTVHPSKTKAVAADQQKENTSDRQITAKVRRAVIADKSLSTYGHNVKIIAQGGAVTLKGPVHSEAEKKAIASEAASVVGEDKVTNQITIKQ